jgi:hypothetical protein
MGGAVQASTSAIIKPAFLSRCPIDYIRHASRRWPLRSHLVTFDIQTSGTVGAVVAWLFVVNVWKEPSASLRPPWVGNRRFLGIVDKAVTGLHGVIYRKTAVFFILPGASVTYVPIKFCGISCFPLIHLFGTPIMSCVCHSLYRHENCSHHWTNFRKSRYEQRTAQLQIGTEYYVTQRDVQDRNCNWIPNNFDN